MFIAKTLRNYIDILHAYAKLQHEKDYIKCITIVNNTVNKSILKMFLFLNVPLIIIKYQGFSPTNRTLHNC